MVLQHSLVTAPGYVIIGGTHKNEGQVITRAYNQTDNLRQIDSENWFVVQTNTDEPDERALAATELMNFEVEREGVTYDGVKIIEIVL